ncbi:Major Facilitator Superfamily protein [Micromonospora echinaurantiaca]|uniref:Major Facilitator Superfamily protein n=1 Tax=Micromonospora echinaurantiaca TaxID=47857 RepID=A0A1C5HKA2_9ACTN|nr:MFS transporter [Micromonospora echinaurantiaca]SCG45991.1 Major Facilitator Superfamily protein [Micromonospora echinaurantiaca]
MTSTRPPAPARGLRSTAGTGYLAGLFVDALGSGLYLPLTVLFFHQVTRLPVTSIGLGLTLAAIAGVAANPVAGVLADRFGARHVVIASYLARAVGFACYPLVDGFTAFVAVAALVAVGDRSYYAANSAYVADLAEGAARDRLYALVRTARNVGFGLGGLFTAAAVEFVGTSGYHLIAVGNAASFLLAAALLAGTARGTGGGRRADPPHADPPSLLGMFAGYRRVLTDRPYRRLVLAELAFTVAHQIFPLAVPVYAAMVLDAPAGLLGVLFTVNAVLVGAGQLAVLRWQRTVRRTHAMAFAGVVFIAAFGAFALAARLPAGVGVAVGLLAATLLFTLGELLHTAPSASLGAGAAPPSHRGRYLAVYQLTWAVSAILAPAGVTGLVSANPQLLWLAAAGIVAVASLTLLRLAPRLPVDAVWPEPVGDGGRRGAGSGVQALVGGGRPARR